MMQSTKKIDMNEVISVLNEHYPNASVVNIEDLSSGCDNWIFCATFDKNNLQDDQAEKIIIRFPRKLTEPDCPRMHNPRFQAYILDILDQNSIPGPKLLHLSTNYLIESFLPDIDLSKVEDKSQLKHIYSQMGFHVKRLHSIECCQRFGYITQIDTIGQKLVAKYDNWLQMFEDEYPDNLDKCLANNLIEKTMFEALSKLFVDCKPYLRSYSEPKLLHSDICANNTRVGLSSDGNGYELTGFIDFADCMCGDPLFDLGELLLSSHGDYSVLDMFESGYGLLSSKDKAMIRFYAIHYNIWLLGSSVLSKDTDKWLHTLQKLAPLERIRENERVWKSMGENERVWESVGENKRVWESMRENERVWQSVGENQKVWKSVGENQKVWESVGENQKVWESVGENQRAWDSVGENKRVWGSMGDNKLE